MDIIIVFQYVIKPVLNGYVDISNSVPITGYETKPKAQLIGLIRGQVQIQLRARAMTSGRVSYKLVHRLLLLLPSFPVADEFFIMMNSNMESLPIDMKNPAVKEYLALIRWVVLLPVGSRAIDDFYQIAGTYTIIIADQHGNSACLHYYC